MRKFSLSGIVLFLITSTVNGQTLSTPSDVSLKFKTRLDATLDPFRQSQHALVNNYVKKMEELKTQFRASGDLDNALKAKSEISILKKSGKLSDQEFTQAATYRKNFQSKSQSNQRLQSQAEIKLRQGFVRGLLQLQEASTKRDDIEVAVKFKKQIEEHQTQIAKLRVFTSDKPVIKSFKIVTGQAADEILSSFDPHNNLAVKSKIYSSESWGNMTPETILKSDRPKVFSDILKYDCWTTAKQTGWLKVMWGSPVTTSKILLVNRGGNAEGAWVRGSVKINSQTVVKIKDFGPLSICVIELREPIALKELRIDITEGRNHPGLSSLEVYK